MTGIVTAAGSAASSIGATVLGRTGDRVGHRRVLLISADLDEVLELSDRIAVIYRGRLTAPVGREALDLESLGRAMVGVEI